MMNKFWTLSGPMILVAAIALAAQDKPKAKVASAPLRPVEYNRDVRPILSENCFVCHGPAAKDAKGGLRLDNRDNAVKDRGGYRVIAPGDVKASILLSRITTKVDGLHMPPKNTGKTLTAAQIDILKRWIAEGAKYQAHWALLAPTPQTVPTVKDKTWVRNSIDAFILARLEAEKLKPEPSADRATLLRRASLSLTGLPPTPAEIDTFLADSSPSAYNRAVDRILASPRYGEHQARYWLDAVRYGDTHGLHLDNERAIYPYRDWVVKAYNDDLPFDKFALYQIAGDLLPNPTNEMMVATGYIRMNPTTAEGGAIEEEFLAKNTFDRVDTTSTVFLGLTVACARCHDHKYDPISQKDYYSMYAYFNSTEDAPMDGNAPTPPPVIRTGSKEALAAVDALRAKIAATEKSVTDAQLTAYLQQNPFVRPKVGAWEVSEVFTAASFDEAYDQDKVPAQWKPQAVEEGKGFVFINQANSSAYLRTTLKSETARSVDLSLGSDDAVKVWLNGKLVHQNRVLRGVDQQTDTVRLELKAGENKLVVKVTNGSGPDGFRYQFGDALRRRLEELGKTKDKPESVAEMRRLYLELGPETQVSKQYRAMRMEVVQKEEALPQTLVAREMLKPRPAFILRRGEYNLPTTPVKRAIPAIFGTKPKDAPPNRLGFAKWLVDQKNPLFARVYVNRIWQQHFGTGLVKTAEDFGNQGEWPSHPELLDHLAVRFVKSGYRLKDLHRDIVTSAAFRQRAVVSAEKLRKDPENRLVSRGPRFRLDAEVLRDQALFVSGLLNERMGGRGFRPYQPDGIWEQIGFSESNTSRYTPDKDDNIYRRSLYMFWKRTSPHPVMLAFDAPMREMCSVRRARTNTPLQSLVTLNEPAFVEAARVFGEKIVKTKRSVPDRIDYAFRRALGRKPSAYERDVLTRSAQRYSAQFRSEPGSSEDILRVGLRPRDPSVDPVENATWMMIASTLFNLDEFLTLH